ncbi:MAG: hypothetical protein FWC72_08020, partial [Oscillospiraceae bacterium]|nr:hypothetical protein [Oscillospiraceae bacterium]
MKSIKRPLVVLIALIIVLSSVPMGALATEPGYDTVDSGPPTDSGIVSDDTGLPADEPPAGDYDLAEDSDVPEAYPPSADADDAAVGDMATPEVNPTLPEEDYAVLVPDETEYDLSALLEIMPLNIPPDTFDIRTGAENTVNWEPNFWVERTVSGTPALVQLRQGEIWTDKSVTYPEITPGVYEGTAVVTLYVWGRTYTAGGEERLLGGDQVVTISTGTGDFLMSGWTASRPGVTIVPATTPVGGTLTWTIPENAIIDPNEPLTITYELFLEGRDLEDWVTNFWYSTAGVRLEVKFQPGEENPIYWTKVEETSPAFEATVNWNNGGGLNSASITDNILNITISFAKNTGTPERQTAEAAPFSTHPQYWPQTATVSYPDGSRRVLHWHLEWMKETVNKVYTIVVHGLEVDVDGTPIGVRYVLDLGGGGGNSARAAGRYITSEYWFRRTADPDSGTPFEWDEQGRLVFSSELMAQVMLVDTDVPTGTLVVRKDIEGLYNQPWYFMDADWFFTARLRIGNDYVAFDPELSTASTLVFSGFVDMPLSTTVIRFTDVNDVITIQGLPTHASGAAASLGAPPLQYWLYEFFTFETLGLIKAYYAVDMSCSCPPEIKNCACFDPMLYNVPEQGDFATSTFSISDAVTRRLDLLNVYDHGIGFINVFKLLDGFPEDWEVVDDTEFYVRIWDEEAQNWLLFDPARINDVSSPFHDSFWCVGNHELGLTDIYPGLVPVMELPISVANRLRVSNLWTGIRYRVVEVRRVGNDNSPANIAATNLAWSQFWTGLDATDRLPVWGGSTWYDNNIRDWIENVWMAEYWEPVEEITPDNVGDSEWHADKAWNWGVIYPWHPENPDPYEVG